MVHDNRNWIENNYVCKSLKLGTKHAEVSSVLKPTVADLGQDFPLQILCGGLKILYF